MFFCSCLLICFIYVVSCHFMICCIISCCYMFCRDMLYYVVLLYVVLHYFVLLYVILFYFELIYVVFMLFLIYSDMLWFCLSKKYTFLCFVMWCVCLCCYIVPIPQNFHVKFKVPSLTKENKGELITRVKYTHRVAQSYSVIQEKRKKFNETTE